MRKQWSKSWWIYCLGKKATEPVLARYAEASIPLFSSHGSSYELSEYISYICKEKIDMMTLQLKTVMEDCTCQNKSL